MWCEFHRVANSATPDFSNLPQTASRFSTLITGIQNRATVATLHGLKPSMKVLLYQETPYTRYLLNAANGYTSDAHAGISEEQAAANNWYAKTAGGALIQNQITQGPDNLVDLGLSAVRTAWSANARSHALSAGGTQNFDGVFADDVNFELESSANAMPGAYPNDAAWWAAVQGMFQAMYPAFRGAGLQLVPNLAKWASWSYDATINGILPYVSGGMQEFFTVFGNGGYDGFYHHSLDVADNCINTAGKKFYAGSHGTAATARYALASLMLVAHPLDPRMQSFTYAGLQDYANEYWDSSFDLNLGAPMLPKQEVGALQGSPASGSYQRQFYRGWALVNPKYNRDGSTRTGATVFDISAGGPYTGSGFTNVTSVSLNPGEGALLAAPLASTVGPWSVT